MSSLGKIFDSQRKSSDAEALIHSHAVSTAYRFQLSVHVFCFLSRSPSWSNQHTPLSGENVYRPVFLHRNWHEKVKSSVPLDAPHALHCRPHSFATSRQRRHFGTRPAATCERMHAKPKRQTLCCSTNVTKLITVQ